MIDEGPCQCPCCDYYALATRGRHEICPVCWWEDDGSDLGELDAVSPANHISLRRARRKFVGLGGGDSDAVWLVRPRSALAGLRRELRAAD